ncbi:MAG: siphovirus Gp157 family protein [Synergistaceae bacterium]|nr:siphovirus Gp157 family protein [Synergistaceae bacterium]
MKLYELTDEYNALWDALNDPEADWDEAEKALLEIEGEFDSKMESCAKIVRSMESEAKGAKEEAERLAARAKALENKSKGLKSYMLSEMRASGREKIRTDIFTIAAQRSPVSLIVHPEDEKLIPEKYWVEVPATKLLDKVCIKDALLGGEAVPGCELYQGYHLRIR